MNGAVHVRAGDHAGADEPWRGSRMRYLLTILLSVLLACPPQVLAQAGLSLMANSPVQDQPGLGDYLLAKSRLEKVFGLMEQARAQIDRSSFDTDALIDQLDYDSEAIIDFVREELRFEQYRGLLRGPTGTLMSAGGNALDQSVLLAKLLNDAGFEARIASGTLDSAQATLLFREAFGHEGGAAKEVWTPELVDTFRAMRAAAGTPGTDISLLGKMLQPFALERSLAYASVKDSASAIQSRMNDALPGFSGPQDASALLAEAREYYWVQWREGASGGWRDVHPALPLADGFPDGIEPAGYITGEIPADMQHRLRLSAKIEQRLGGKRVVHELMPPWERPVANLIGVPLTYGNHPDSLATSDDYLDIPSSLRRTELFFPALNGSLPANARAFDLQGRVIDSDAAGSQAAGVFKQVGDAFGEATAALGEGPAEELVRHWLEFSFIAPGGETETIERAVFDSAGTAGEDVLKIVAQLAREHTFMVSAGDMPNSYALDEILRRMLSSRVVLEAVLQRAYFIETPVEMTYSEMNAVESEWWGHFLLFPAFARAAAWAADDLVYVSGPQLVVHAREPAARAGLVAYIDIVRNERRALTMADGELKTAPSALVAAGVWETAMEGHALSADAGTPMSTFVAVDVTRPEKLRVIMPSDGTTVERLQLPADVAANLSRDLERGYAVILPPADAASVDGWWRVHPVTGETLGQLSNGRGSAFTEALSLISGVISFAFWLKGMGGCLAKSNSLAFSCCVATNTAFWIGGGIVGAYVGVTGLIAALGAFAGDVAYNVATAKIDLCGG
jgi:hypothetical protein